MCIYFPHHNNEIIVFRLYAQSHPLNGHRDRMLFCNQKHGVVSKE